MVTEEVTGRYLYFKMADESLGKCSIFVHWGGITSTRQRLSVRRGKKCVETFRNTDKVAANPVTAERGVCRSVLKRTVTQIWRECTCSSKYKLKNGACWLKTVFAEWERHLQQFEIRWNASDRSYFSIHVWNSTRAYRLRNNVCTCDLWDVHNVIRTCSQVTYFFTYTCMNCPLPFVYIIIWRSVWVQVCCNNTSMV